MTDSDLCPGSLHRSLTRPTVLVRVVGIAIEAVTGRLLVIYHPAALPAFLRALPPAVFAVRYEPAEPPAPERPADPPPLERVIDLRSDSRHN